MYIANSKVVTSQSWSMRHSGKCGSIFGNACGKAATVAKTISAFRSTGRWTVNRDLFQDHHVFPSLVNTPVIIYNYNNVLYYKKNITVEAELLSPSIVSRGSVCTLKKMTENLVVAGREIGLEVNAEKT